MNILKKILKIKEPIPAPEPYPDFHNVKEWMEQKTIYFINKYPENASDLFNPSAGDYLPRTITAGTSSKIFNEVLNDYREIKSRYPELVEEAKKNFNPNSYSSAGDKEDYPKNW